MYSYLCYKHPNLLFDFSNPAYHKAIINTHIPTGTVLCIEHTISSDFPEKLQFLVSNNELLFDRLYPRHSSWKSLLNKQNERYNHAFDKIHSNVFTNQNNTLTELGYYITIFNHSCNPNSIKWIRYFENESGKIVSFSFIVSIKNIYKDDEITISYKNNIGHTTITHFNFICNCGKSDSERLKCDTVITKLSEHIIENVNPFINRIIIEYLHSDLYKNIIVHQQLALYYDFYISNNSKNNHPKILTTHYFTSYYFNRFNIPFDNDSDTSQKNMNIIMNDIIKEYEFNECIKF